MWVFLRGNPVLSNEMLFPKKVEVGTTPEFLGTDARQTGLGVPFLLPDHPLLVSSGQRPR